MSIVSESPRPERAAISAVCPLFDPLALGRLRLRNRIAMSPMTRCFSPGNTPGEDVAAYYRRRAEGGTGLIVTEGVGIDHGSSLGDSEGGPWERIPILHGEEALAGWRAVVDAVHRGGGAIFPQLWHQGAFRICGTGLSPETPSARPSGIWGPTTGYSTVTEHYIARVSEPTRPMTDEEIADVVAAFARSAVNAKSVGFDGIAIHGASGYLIDSFFWPETNRRTDRYGGDMHGRATFGAEVVRSIREAVGPDMPLLFRFGQWKQQDFKARIAETPDELGILLRALAEAGVDIFDASALYFSVPAFEGADLSLAAWAKKLSGKPTIAVGGIGLSQDLFSSRSTGGADVANNFIDAARRIDAGEFDMIGVGRALIADPEWPDKVRSGAPTLPFSRSMLATLV